MEDIFQNATKRAGITKGSTNTFSTAWVDFNGDGLSDLWISPHGYRGNCACGCCSGPGQGNRAPRLYLNQGDGTFKNIIWRVWPDGIRADSHGSAWADYDNDGDPDLFVSTGAQSGQGTGPELLFVNEGGQLQEQAKDLGISYSLARGRSALWFDYNQDGLLDIFLVNDRRSDRRAPTALFQQTQNGFEKVNELVDININQPKSDFAQLADLFGDGTLDLIIHARSEYPLKAYDTSAIPFENLTKTFAKYQDISDVAIADFNGDLRQDLFLAAAPDDTKQSSTFRINENTVLADLVAKLGEVGIRFKANGKVSFDFSAQVNNGGDITTSQIFIGSQGRHPTDITFSLSPNDPRVRGIKTHTPGSQTGLYIGYDPTRQTWQAFLSSPGRKHLELVVESSGPLTNLFRVGFDQIDLSEVGPQNALLQYSSITDQFLDRTREAGLSDVTYAQHVVSGDFDNDMDVDLYLANGYSTFNLPNILYENQGDGTFVADPEAAGATDPHRFSIGSRMAVADYDNNGFLDIFISHFEFKATANSYPAPEQLFRNTGNGNHWIQLDLEGVVSNRDGIGARVLATAGGVTQLREQAGGMHAFGQDQQRIHFGLANNSLVDHLGIRWSSGIVQDINNAPADQILRVVEGIGDRFDNTITGTGDDNTFDGGPGGDILDGLGGQDILVGGDGKDILNGGGESDTLTGGSNRDTFIIRRGNSTDTVTDFGALGNKMQWSQAVLSEIDVLKFEGAGLIARNMLLTQNGSDLLVTFAGIEKTKVVLEGIQLEDLDNLRGSPGASVGIGNILFDGQSDIENDFDVFETKQQRDSVFNSDSVTFLNNLNNQTKGFAKSDDVINGQGGNDLLQGLSGDDFLRGGAGNDTLIGTAFGAVGEMDILTSGTGMDRFILGNTDRTFYDNGNPITSGASDYAMITDFNLNQDIIQLSGQRNDYFLYRSPADFPQGVSIYLNKPGDQPDELISIVKGSSGISLDGNYFNFV